MTSDRPLTVIDLAREAASLAPGLPSRLIARLNDSGVRLAVYEGEADWHAHPGTDECFVVLEGELSLDVFEGPTLTLGPGQAVTIPTGVVHRPRAGRRTVLLCIKRLEGATDYFELVAGPTGDPTPATPAG